MSAAAPAAATPRRISGLTLGILMIVANILGYAVILVATRALGPEQFGAFSAVNNSGLLLAIPVGAIQIVVARRQGERPGTGLELAGAVGGGLVVLGVAASPLAVGAFHLTGPMTFVLAMANLLPMAVTAAMQGVLLGRARMVAFGLSVLFTAVSRVAAVWCAARAGFGVDGFFAVLLVAGVAAAVVPWLQARPDMAGLGHRLGHGAVRELLRANRTLGALVALSTVDLLLARHYLTASDAGAYALGSVFSKVVMWGTQFLAIGIVPALHPSNTRKRVVEAAGFVALLGGIGVVIAATTAPWLIRLSGGTAYEHATGMLPWFVVLGTLLGLAQVLVYAGMAGDDGRLGVVAWVACVALTALVVGWQHAHAWRILAVALVASAGVVGVGLLDVLRRAPAPLDGQRR